MPVDLPRSPGPGCCSNKPSQSDIPCLADPTSDKSVPGRPDIRKIASTLRKQL